jgi:hypothetical protein
MKVTKANLNAVLSRVTRNLQAPSGPTWIKNTNGQLKAAVGALHIESGSKTYGRYWKLCEIVNEGGGQSVLLSAPTAAALYDQMHAFCLGLETANYRQAVAA